MKTFKVVAEFKMARKTGRGPGMKTYSYTASADPLKNTDTPERYADQPGYPHDLAPIDWCTGTVEAYEFKHASEQVHRILLARKAGGLAPGGTVYEIKIGEGQ